MVITLYEFIEKHNISIKDFYELTEKHELFSVNGEKITKEKILQLKNELIKNDDRHIAVSVKLRSNTIDAINYYMVDDDNFFEQIQQKEHNMELVKIENNQVVVSSRDVAEKFGKEHKHVLDSIRQLITAENSAMQLFQEVTYKTEENGRSYPEFLMNRDGRTKTASKGTHENHARAKTAIANALPIF